ncbi:DUF3891 family protein [Nitrospinota bacterium]
MIVRPLKDGVRLISQHDHARAAGSLLRHWAGVEAIPAPPSELRGSINFAVDNHDVGWCKADESPRLDRETKLPFSFFGITSEEATEIWSESIATCSAYRAFSGYLVSVHFGLLADAACRGAPPDALSTLKEFVRTEKKRQESLMKEFSPLEDELRENATMLLRTCDTLSLLSCRAPEITPPEGQVHPLRRCGLNVRTMPDDSLEVSPWPFDVERLELHFPGATIPGKRFGNGEELDDALDRAEPEVFVSQLAPLS